MIPTAARTCNINTTISILVRSTRRTRRPADDRHFVCIERCATDQSTVDVGHREKLRGIAAFDASAVKHLHAICDRRLVVREPLAYERVYRLRLLGTRGLSGADRPYRLIRDDCVRERLSTRPCNDSRQLGGHDRFRLTRLALR